MTHIHETQYRIHAPPTSTELNSPHPTSPSDCNPPLYHFSKEGLEKINFCVPYSYAFFEEKSVDGCPKHLKIYLLGHENCESIFFKYAENVEYIDFFGCFEYPEVCFRVCSQMKKLKEIRFLINASKINNDIPPTKKVKSWNGLKNPKVCSMKIITDVPNYHKKSVECKNSINNYLETLLDYPINQLPNIRGLRLELPDTENLLSLTRTVLRLPIFQSPKISIILDESIQVKYEVVSGSQTPTTSLMKRNRTSVSSLSPETNETISASLPNKEYHSPITKPKEPENPTKPPVSIQEKQTIVNVKPTVNPYSYQQSTAERLLREAAVALDKKPEINLKKRSAEPLEKVDIKKPKDNTEEPNSVDIKCQTQTHVTDISSPEIESEMAREETTNLSTKEDSVHENTNSLENRNRSWSTSTDENDETSKSPTSKETNIRSRTHVREREVEVDYDRRQRPERNSRGPEFASSYYRREDLNSRRDSEMDQSRYEPPHEFSNRGSRGSPSNRYRGIRRSRGRPFYRQTDGRRYN